MIEIIAQPLPAHKVPVMSGPRSDRLQCPSTTSSTRNSTAQPSDAATSNATPHVSTIVEVEVDHEATSQQGIPIVRIKFPPCEKQQQHRLYIKRAIDLAEQHGYYETGIMKIVSNIPSETDSTLIYGGLLKTAQDTKLRKGLAETCHHQYFEPEGAKLGQYVVQRSPVTYRKLEDMLESLTSEPLADTSLRSGEFDQYMAEHDKPTKVKGSMYLRDYAFNTISRRATLGIGPDSPIWPIPECELQQGLNAQSPESQSLDIQGLTSPFAYISVFLGSAFAQHKEDASAASANYVHLGVKNWYAISGLHYEKLVRIYKEGTLTTHEGRLDCTAFLKHFSKFWTREACREHGIPMTSVEQGPGEIVIVARDTVHWGYNSKFCVSEAVNFTFDVEGILRGYKPCTPGQNYCHKHDPVIPGTRIKMIADLRHRGPCGPNRSHCHKRGFTRPLDQLDGTAKLPRLSSGVAGRSVAARNSTLIGDIDGPEQARHEPSKTDVVSESDAPVDAVLSSSARVSLWGFLSEILKSCTNLASPDAIITQLKTMSDQDYYNRRLLLVQLQRRGSNHNLKSFVQASRNWARLTDLLGMCSILLINYTWDGEGKPRRYFDDSV